LSSSSAVPVRLIDHIIDAKAAKSKRKEGYGEWSIILKSSALTLFTNHDPYDPSQPDAEPVTGSGGGQVEPIRAMSSVLWGIFVVAGPAGLPS